MSPSEAARGKGGSEEHAARRQGQRIPFRPPTPFGFANPLHGVEHIDYKDVTLLRRFISDKGKIRSRRITRVTARQQRLLAKAVKNAREMALLPYAVSITDPARGSG